MAFLRLENLLDDGLEGVRLERLQDVALHAKLHQLDDPAGVTHSASAWIRSMLSSKTIIA